MIYKINRLIHLIYFNLPFFVQNIIITILNNIKYYQKYGALPFVNSLNKISRNSSNIVINDNNTIERINTLIKKEINIRKDKFTA